MRRRLRKKEIFEFIFGAVLFVGSTTLRLLDSFQRLEYLKAAMPGLYGSLLSSPIQYGTMIIGIAVMVAGVIGIYRNRASAGEQQQLTKQISDGLELRSTADPNGLKVWLQNNSERTVADCEVFLAGVQRYSAKEHEFERIGIFSGVSLIEPQTLGPKKQTMPQSLFELPKPNATFLIAFDASGRRKPVCSVDKEGIWRAEINVITASGSYREELFFQWAPGTSPNFVRDPRMTI